MEENLAKQNGRFIIKIFPLIIINLFVAVSLLLFKFGLINWKMDKVNLAILYIISVYCVFSLGYLFVVKKSKQEELTDNQKDVTFFYARLIFIIGIAVSIVYHLAWIYFTFGNDFARFLLAPGAAYDYAEYLQKLYTSGNGFEYPMTFRWISRINTVMGGGTTAAIPLGLYLFNKVSKYEKVGIVALICLYIIRSILIGAQSSFFILVVMIIVVLLCKTVNIFMDSESGKTRKGKVHYELYSIGIICILGVCFLVIMLLFQNDRAKQRDIRRELYNISMEEYGKVSSEQLQYNLLRSIEIRIGKELFGDIVRVDVISEQRNQSETNVTEQKTIATNNADTDTTNESDQTDDINAITQATVNDAKENAKQTENKTQSQTLESNFTGIDKYFESKKDGWLYKNFPSISYGIQSVEMYLTQGYGGLALAMQHEFEWTYFIGSSKIFTSLVEGVIGSNIFERTYVYKNEAINGWSSQTYFNSVYTWLASDYTFFGVIVLFGLLGMLFAQVWLDLIIRKNIVALIMVYLIMFGLFMASTVNILFQTLGSFISSWGIIAFYIISILLIKKGDFLYEKFISKNRG